MESHHVGDETIGSVYSFVRQARRTNGPLRRLAVSCRLGTHRALQGALWELRRLPVKVVTVT
jgi:hypothetical protein